MPLIMTIKDYVACVLIAVGVLMFIIEVYGVYRFSFVLNRMHAAAIGDTLGLSCCILGLILLKGFSYTSIKFLLVIMFVWISSPVSSHLIARFEVEANENVHAHCSEKRLEDKEDDTCK